MTGLVASDAALAAIRELAKGYGFLNPVVCVMRQVRGVDFVRGGDGQVIRTEGDGGWNTTVVESDAVVGLPFLPVSWQGLELLCDGPVDPSKQLYLEVVDGELRIQERAI